MNDIFNKIYNVDCLEGMKEIPDGAVDFVLSDLPFGTVDCDWDKRIPFEPMWEQFKRVTKKNAAVALFSQMPFGAELIMSNRKNFRYEWIVFKDKKLGYLNSKKMPLRCHENILIFYEKLPTYNPQFTQGRKYKKKHNPFDYSNSVYNKARLNNSEYVIENKTGLRYPVDVIDAVYNQSTFKEGTTLWGGKSLNKHPTQKPVALLEYLIKTYTNEGEIVLDATIGSGSTAVAAINTNRKFIGYELDEKYFEIAQKRINEALAKKSQGLF